QHENQVTNVVTHARKPNGVLARKHVVSLLSPKLSGVHSGRRKLVSSTTSRRFRLIPTLGESANANGRKRGRQGATNNVTDLRKLHTQLEGSGSVLVWERAQAITQVDFNRNRGHVRVASESRSNRIERRRSLEISTGRVLVA